MTVKISAHAAQRYIERVDGSLSTEQARAAIMASARVLEIAVKFGAGCVKLDNGARLILEGDVVVTVKQSHGAERRPASCAMFKRWRRQSAAA